MSDLCSTVARMVTLKGSVSRERERHSKFLSYPIGARNVLSAVSLLIVAQPSSEVPEGLMNYPVQKDNAQGTKYIHNKFIRHNFKKFNAVTNS
jgi:hypothetical protein